MQTGEEYLKLDEAALIKTVQDPAASIFQKNVACRRLALVGTRDAVPALTALLGDANLAHYACVALAPIPDPSVDDALRGQLITLKGPLLIGVINTIGQRKDERAVDPLAKLLHAPEAVVAEAAAAALGNIGGPAAAKVLRDALAITKGPVRAAVADAALVCAESLHSAVTAEVSRR